jgi:hypothetical protein
MLERDLTDLHGWCPHHGSGSRLLSDVLKTGEDNETALRRSSLWISYGGVVNRVCVRRVEHCFPFPFSSRATSSSCLPPSHARENHRSRVSPSTRQIVFFDLGYLKPFPSSLGPHFCQIFVSAEAETRRVFITSYSQSESKFHLARRAIFGYASSVGYTWYMRIVEQQTCHHYHHCKTTLHIPYLLLDILFDVGDHCAVPEIVRHTSGNLMP